MMSRGTDRPAEVYAYESWTYVWTEERKSVSPTNGTLFPLEPVPIIANPDYAKFSKIVAINLKLGLYFIL